MKERTAQNLILRHFGAHPQVRLWRQNTGVAQYGERSVRFGLPGQADLTGLVRGTGRRLEIECKSDKGRLTAEQQRYGEMIRKMGGVYIVARNVQDVYEGLALHGVTLRPAMPVPPKKPEATP